MKVLVWGRHVRHRKNLQWRQIQRRVLEGGRPKKQFAREAGMSGRTLNKILTHEGPPGYGPGPFLLPGIKRRHSRDLLLLTEAAFPIPAAGMTIWNIC